MAKTSEVTISNRKYQLTKMNPELACRIYGWFVGVMFQYSKDNKPTEENAGRVAAANAEVAKQTPQAAAEGTVLMLWTIAPQYMSEENYSKVQAYALQHCNCYERATNALLPLKMQDGSGRWIDQELEDDPAAVNELITKSLQFSISVLFTQGLARLLTMTVPKAS